VSACLRHCRLVRTLAKILHFERLAAVLGAQNVAGSQAERRVECLCVLALWSTGEMPEEDTRMTVADQADAFALDANGLQCGYATLAAGLSCALRA